MMSQESVRKYKEYSNDPYSKLTLEQKRAMQQKQEEEKLKTEKKFLLAAEFKDVMKEEINIVDTPTETKAKFIKELNIQISNREKLEKKMFNLHEELYKAVQDEQHEERSMFIQSFLSQPDKSIIQNSMAYNQSQFNDKNNTVQQSIIMTGNVSKFQQTLYDSTYMNQSKQRNMEALAIELEKIKEKLQKTSDLREIQQDTQQSLQEKIKDIRFTTRRVQKELNDLKKIRETSEKKILDLETRSLNAQRKQNHITNQLNEYTNELIIAKEKEKEYLGSLREEKNQIQKESQKLQDEIANILTQIELKNSDIYDQAQQMEKLDQDKQIIEEKLINSNIIQEYLECFEIIHKSFIKDNIQKLGDQIYTLQQHEIPFYLVQFLLKEKQRSTSFKKFQIQDSESSVFPVNLQNIDSLNLTHGQSQNGKGNYQDDSVQNNESQYSRQLNNQIQNTQLTEREEEVDRKSMVQYLQEFYDEFESPDQVVDLIIQKFKELTIFNNSLYTQYNGLMSQKKQQESEIQKLQDEIDKLQNNEQNLDQLMTENLVRPVQRKDSQEYPVFEFQQQNNSEQNQNFQQNNESGENNENNENNEKNEQQNEKQQDGNLELDQFDKYSLQKEAYEQFHNLSKMKEIYEKDTEDSSNQLLDLVQKTQQFNFKLFFGLIEAMYRNTVTLKLLLDSHQDEELKEFYSLLKPFVYVLRLGFNPKRSESIQYQKLINDEINGYKNERDKKIKEEKINLTKKQYPQRSNNKKLPTIIAMDMINHYNNIDKEEQPNQKRQLNSREREENFDIQHEKFRELLNFIPLENYEIQNIVLEYFPDFKDEAMEFAKLLKQDLIVILMLSQQNIRQYIESILEKNGVKIEPNNQIQKNDGLNIQESKDESDEDVQNDQDQQNKKNLKVKLTINEQKEYLKQIFSKYTSLQNIALNVYHTNLEKLFDYFGKYITLLRKKYTHIWENCGEEVKNQLEKNKKQDALRFPKSQVDFNMKIINQIIEEKNNPDFNRGEYYQTTNKETDYIDEEKDKPDWRKIIFKLAEESKKTYNSNHYDKKDPDEEKVNLYNKETLEQRRIQNMDDDEYLEHERKQIKLGLKNSSQNSYGNQNQSVQQQQQQQQTNNTSFNNQNLSKSNTSTKPSTSQSLKIQNQKYMRELQDNDKVIWNLRTLEVQMKQYESKFDKLTVDDYIPKKFTNSQAQRLSQLSKPKEGTQFKKSLDYKTSMNFFKKESINNSQSLSKLGSQKNNQKLVSLNQDKNFKSIKLSQLQQDSNNNSNFKDFSLGNSQALNQKKKKRGNYQSQYLPKLEKQPNKNLQIPVLGKDYYSKNNYFMENNNDNLNNQSNYSKSTRNNSNNKQLGFNYQSQNIYKQPQTNKNEYFTNGKNPYNIQQSAKSNKKA